jgi:hypothetical protein
MAGKPYSPIYEVALEQAARVLGRDIQRHEVLAIGDGLPTDVQVHGQTAIRFISSPAAFMLPTMMAPSCRTLPQALKPTCRASRWPALHRLWSGAGLTPLASQGLA